MSALDLFGQIAGQARGNPDRELGEAGLHALEYHRQQGLQGGWDEANRHLAGLAVGFGQVGEGIEARKDRFGVVCQGLTEWREPCGALAFDQKRAAQTLFQTFHLQ